jgi:ABC-2 type transport system ATP-binding protein
VGAAAFVGRVGGLAAALGIGLLIGSPAAAADDSGTRSGDSATARASESSASATGNGPRRSGGPQPAPTVDTVTTPKPAVAQENPLTRTNRFQPRIQTATAPAELADVAAPAAGTGPGVPIGEQLDLAALVPARRHAESAASLAQPPVATMPSAASTGSVFGNSITVNPDVGWSDGLLLGTLDATSSRGLPLKYTVVDSPSLGGKLTWEPEPAGSSVKSGRFSYLPAMGTLTDASQTETFAVMVAEVTAFNRFITGLPVIGLLAEPLLETLHRLPLISTLLAPLIGSATVVRFDESAAALAAGRPVAFTYLMPSFDGTPISVNYFPATNVSNGDVESAPTVLNGPDLGFPGNTDVFSVWDTSLVNIVPGINAMRTDASPYPGGYSGGGGYNVITWDPRGEWASGGRMQLDNPNFEGRDVSSIISWATSAANVAQSQVATDPTGDPYIGMVGGSYGGGIQLAVAGTPDRRVDAIVPSIAWNTLNESLYPNNIFKTVIGSELLLALVTTGARINGEIYVGILSGALFGFLSSDSQALLTNAGPGVLVNNIVAPTLFLQGTPDILFELNESTITGAMMALANPDVPVKTTWFCGGHGVCLLPSSMQDEQGQLNMNDTLRWLGQYVAGNGTPADEIPTFQWFDQTGQYHSSDLNPFDPAFNNPTPLSYQSDGGSLVLVPLLGGSGPSDASVPPALPTVFSDAFALASGSRAWNALNSTVTMPVGTLVAGTPTLSFSYRGLGTSRAVYAQLVDNATGQVVGNIVTPVPVTLDGRERTVEIPMGAIAYTVNTVSDSLTLQITSSALPYANLTAWGFIDIDDVSLDVPTVAPAD